MKVSKLQFLIITLFFIAQVSFSQNENFTISTIPITLYQNTNAVVRDNITEIIVEDVDKMIVKQRKVVTVLNKLGNVDARMGESYDNDTKITSLSAKIYNNQGEEIKKYKKRDFLDVSSVSGGTLYSDSRAKYIEYTPVSYPYTIVFESEYKTSTTGFIPPWFPVNEYHVSVEKSSYVFKNPKKIPFRFKEINFEGFAISKTTSDTGLSYVLVNQPALKYEYSTVAYRKLLPKALVALNKSSLKGVYGEYTNWKEFGKWMYDNLLVGRDIVSLETQNKILELVKGEENPIERAKIVYQFMQNKTRYISVQVGIGGWEPIAANKVDAVGYGDCKGLTNYTKTLLDIANVTSYYTVVYADEKRDIDKDFASIQGNHIILNIPNDGNDIWLECTSQTMPFGFLGDFTEGRNVLVITPEGGVIKKTTSYVDDFNTQETKATIVLNEDGNATSKLTRVSKGIQYDDRMGIENYSEDKIKNYYKSKVWDYINNLKIEEKEIINNKDSVLFKEKISLNVKDYATIQNNEYLFTINMLNRINQVPKRYRKRNLPLEVYRGYKDVDEYTIKIPKNYKIAYLPAPTKIKTKFGSYEDEITKVDENTLQYKRSIIIKSGVYPKEEYNSYRKFRRSTARKENQRIALLKK